MNQFKEGNHRKVEDISGDTRIILIFLFETIEHCNSCNNLWTKIDNIEP
jgi:hypothetical protein